MKKMTWIISLLLILFLSSCQEPSAEFIVIQLNSGVDTVEIGTNYIDPGATAKYGLRNLEVQVISNTVDTQVLGTYEIIYQATHDNFIKTTKRMVTVIDETPPLIVLNPGLDTIYLDETWVDAGVVVTDASNGNITITQTGTVSSSPGEYRITYIATDESGNVSTKVRFVNVIGR
ncbi:MAG: DUF5011 domain-containing protein [Firmicutes bacterium]|nr:DUF5011 domain-containing protein [Bacillota bacterium]